MRTKIGNIILFSVIFIVGCGNVSEEALNAGFKNEKDYQIHLNNLNIERDSEFKERILYATNLKIFDEDNQYNEAIELLKKQQRKYLSQGGSNINLIVSSNSVIELKSEFDSVVNSKQDALEKATNCYLEIDIDLSEYKDSSMYGIMEASKTLQELQCRMQMIADSEYLSENFMNIHSAARSLANQQVQFDSEEAALKYMLDYYDKG